VLSGISLACAAAKKAPVFQHEGAVSSASALLALGSGGIVPPLALQRCPSGFHRRPGIELDASFLDDPPDVLAAFRSHIIVRRPFLESIPLCINFHPGPPERRGSGCVNFAIAAGDESYGVTCHYIDEEVDHGSIIEVRRFPMSESDGVA
jgi:hypothetical protein